MSGDGKTRNEPLAEFNGPQCKINALAGMDQDGDADAEESPGGEQSKRDLVRAGRVAPVNLAVNLSTPIFAGASAGTGTPTPAPTPQPTV